MWDFFCSPSSKPRAPIARESWGTKEANKKRKDEGERVAVAGARRLSSPLRREIAVR